MSVDLIVIDTLTVIAKISNYSTIRSQIRVARSQRVRENDFAQLSGWPSQFEQRRDTGPWQRAGHSGERRARPARWLHATGAGLVRRLHHQGDSPVFWSHLQFAGRLCRFAVRVSDQIVGPACQRSLRQDAERRTAATRLLRRRLVPRARIAHLGRTYGGSRPSTQTQVRVSICMLLLLYFH